MRLLPKHTTASVLGLLLPVGLAAQLPDGGRQSVSAARIDVVADDYTFLPLPKTVDAGPTLFTFANRGKVLHELALGRLKAGTTADDVVKGMQTGARAREFMSGSAGILVAGPGGAPEGRLLVDLKPGETYLVFCNFRDNPQAPQHMMLGMYTVFQTR